MSREIIYSIALVMTIFTSFLLTNTEMASYVIFVLSGLFIIFFILKRLWPQQTRYIYFFESILATFTILQIVNSTGALHSAFFPLLYFLIFTLSLLLDPFIGLSGSVMLVIFYLLFYSPSQSIQELFPLFGLLLLSPFAAFVAFQLENNRALGKQMTKAQENDFLFLSLVVKKHLGMIRETVQNFRGDHDLETITRIADRLSALIDRFEKEKQI